MTRVAAALVACALATCTRNHVEEKPMRTYTWGAVGCDGLAIGLHGPARAVAGAPYEYWLGVANRGTAARKVTLFYNMEGTYRMRVYLADGGHPSRFVGPAAEVPSTAPMRVEVDLAAGQVHEAAGTPFPMPADATAGAATLEVVYGGTEAERCEVRSAALAITIERSP